MAKTFYTHACVRDGRFMTTDTVTPIGKNKIHVGPQSAAAAAAAVQVPEHISAEYGDITKNASSLELSFQLSLSLMLDKEHESKPYLHVYLSNHVSLEYHEVQIGDVHKTSSIKGASEFTVLFDKLRFHILSADTKQEDLMRHLWKTAYLNFDVFSMIKNAYGEACPQRAGSFRICVAKLLYLLASSHPRDYYTREISGKVDMPHVFPENYRIKGNFTVSCAQQATRPFVHFNGAQPELPSATEKNEAYAAKLKSYQESQDRLRGYVDACTQMFARIPPTWPSVARHNANDWQSRVGMMPALAYAVDPTPTHITERYYQNALKIVTERNHLSAQQVQSAAEAFISGSFGDQDIALVSKVASQMLCLFVVHCIYRKDFVYACVRDKNGHYRYVEVETEDFGDAEVDCGASDCEDFTKNIARHHRRFTEPGRIFTDPTLKLLQNFLRCYYPAMVLLGVSSAEINAAPGNASRLGAHENAFLIPKKMFFEISSRLYPKEFENWREQVWDDLKAIDEEKNWKRSEYVPVLVLEGTGFLQPVSSKDTESKGRKIAEYYMEDDRAYYALRRWYYYEKGKDSNFIKTIQKMFFPDILRMGFRFGSFLVCTVDPANARVTRGVRFSDFSAKNYSNIAYLMEPEFKFEEKIAIRELMRDIHPVPFQDAPVFPDESYMTEDHLIREVLIPALSGSKAASATVPLKEGTDVYDMTYFLRKSECRPEVMRALVDFFSKKLPVGAIRAFEVNPEKVTDQVGGYRIELKLADPENVLSHSE